MTEPLLQFFEYKHLPPHLQTTSQIFHDLAHDLCTILPDNPEREMGMRKLLEAKDCFVRSTLWKEPAP